MSRLWDIRARLYDIFEGSSFRRGESKRALFQDMRGHVLFLAMGTGADVSQFPPGRTITAIDISKEMLRRAKKRCALYPGEIELIEADAMALDSPDTSFDTVVTSCTLCSVPNPLRVLMELYRVLRPGGRLLMFEHVRSRNWMLGLTLDLMTLWTRLFGTEMNRDTLGTVRKAGFQVTNVESVYLDIILAIRGVKPRSKEVRS